MNAASARFRRLPFSLDPLIAEAKRRMRRRRLIAAIVAAAFALGTGLVLHSRWPSGSPSEPSGGTAAQDSREAGGRVGDRLPLTGARVYLIEAPGGFSLPPWSVKAGSSVLCRGHGMHVLVRVPERGHHVRRVHSYADIPLLTLTLKTKPDGTVRGQCLAVIPR